MKKIGFCFCLLFGVLIFGQEPIKGTTELNELVLGKTTIEAEKPAYFPLGTPALQKMIEKNFRMRKIIAKADIETCEIYFIIDKEGNMTNIKAVGTNESFNNEAVKAISKIKEKWIPAELNGKKVRYLFKIPLTVNFN